MRRREFLLGAGGATSAAAVGAGPAAAQETETPSVTATGTTGGNATGTSTGTATAGGGAGGTTHTVDMTDGLVYDPSELTIAPGDTVVWKNVGTVGHTVTAYADQIPEGAAYFASGGFDSEQAARNGYPERGNIPGGESYQHTFETTGEYGYFCIPHEAVGMTGTITVQEGGAGGGEAAAGPAVPDAAKTFGLGLFLAMLATLGLAYGLLKYGGSVAEPAE